MTERERNIHTARVLLTEAQKRRGQAFGWVLLGWAANARRRAAEMRREPEQGGLFA